MSLLIPAPRPALLAAGLALVLAAQAQQPSYVATMEAGTGTRNVIGPSDLQGQTSAIAAAVSSLSGVIENQPASGGGGPVVSSADSQGAARVGPGRIEFASATAAQTSAFRAPSSGGAGIRGYASLNDQFTLLAPGCAACTGQYAVMTFALSFSGLATTAGSATGDIVGSAQSGGGWSGYSQWRSYASVQAPAARYLAVPWYVDAAATGDYRDGTDVANPGGTSTGLGIGTHTFEMAVQFGEIVSLQWLAYLYIDNGVSSTGNEANFAGQTTAEAASSLLWAGIQGMRLLDGTPVGGITAFNPNGVDYATGFTGSLVPEPATGALALPGVLALLGLKRWRRQAST